MSTLLTGGTLVELEPASVEPGSLRIQDGRIVARGAELEPVDGDEVVELKGKLVLPGFVSTHHQLHVTLHRGREPLGEQAERPGDLERYEKALDLDAVEASAAMGALEGLFSGVTTVFDLHASPSAAAGSLSRVARGLGTVGLRGVLAYQVSDRGGALHREEAIDECADYAKRARGRFRGAVGAQGLALAPDELLQALKQLVSGGAWLHAAVGQDADEEGQSTGRHDATVLQRLGALGLLGERTLLAHLVHCSWPELSLALGSGSYLAHVARANLARMGGAGAAAKFGVRTCLGTGTWALDVLGEAQAAWLKSRDAGAPIDPLRLLANGQRLASAVFGAPLNLLREGALADLVIVDYPAPTAVDAGSLAAHLMRGVCSRHVESVMVDGIWRLWNRRVLGVKVEDVALAAREAAKDVAGRLAD